MLASVVVVVRLVMGIGTVEERISSIPLFNEMDGEGELHGIIFFLLEEVRRTVVSVVGSVPTVPSFLLRFVLVAGGGSSFFLERS